MGVPTFFGQPSRSRYPAAVRRSLQALAQVANSPSGDIVNPKTAIPSGHVVSTTGVIWVPGVGTDHDIAWNTPVFDTDSFYSAGSPTLFTIPISGIYQLFVQIDYTSAGDTAYLQVKQNGTTALNKTYYTVVNTGTTTSIVFSDIIHASLAANDTIKVVANFTAGFETLPAIYASLALVGAN